MAIKTIPLRRRDGSTVAEVLVDEEDYERLAPHTWCMTSDGYAKARVGRSTVMMMHRFILEMGPGSVGGLEVDHVNRNRLDNRRENLRVVTPAMNRQNAEWDGRGVGRHPGGGWRARVVVDGREHCKRCRTRDEAQAVVREMRARLMPYSPEAAEVAA